MCGITGAWNPTKPLSEPEQRDVAARMAATLRHRGPDADGVWVDAAAGIALGHTRLSIIDLSPAGAQPMISADGRLVLVYNGEIYNHRELRVELEARGSRFRGHSDTEVILEACAVWGVAAALPRFIGMFAFALWDRKSRRLTLARDRIGIKPLFWGKFGDLVLFGSELKALRAHPGWRPEIDVDAVAAFFRFLYVPAPGSIYRGVHKVPPGHILTLEAGMPPRFEAFWRLRDVVRRGLAEPFTGSESEAEEQLDRLLRDAVKRRMVADVKVGAFLSGGIDSSTVVAMMQAQSDRKVATFSIGYREAAYDEAGHARRVAAHLGTDHTEFYLDAPEALATVPHLAEWYDEPFADASQIPTYIVSRLTRAHATVALSGDGGDELFAGYGRHLLADQTWRLAGRVPYPLRRMLGGTLDLLSPDAWHSLLGLVPERLRPLKDIRRSMPLLKTVLNERYSDRQILYSLTWVRDPRMWVPSASDAAVALLDPDSAADMPLGLARALYLDTISYLPDDILTKVDRASMAVSLEVRVPLLDHRVVEFAWSLPERFKLAGDDSKRLLRAVLARYVPRELFERPKVGFHVPTAEWVKGPLRDWAESLLAPARLADGGIIDPEPIRRCWKEHLAGERDWNTPIWAALMFQAWRERWEPATQRAAA
jgi:asparagine synthase (glutamine-hydrolysing)